MKRILIICSVFLNCLSPLLFATDYVVITEIMYDTPLNEDQSYDIHNAGEFIELYNAYEYEADISGWILETDCPKQTFNIPNGVVLAPHSTLIIAYKPYDTYSYDPSNPNEYDNYKGDFCWLYGIKNNDNLEILFQDSIILPNTITTLVLKDANGQIRDYTLFADDFPESPLHSPNGGIISADGRCLENVYSVQRRRINFNEDGSAVYNYLDWGGWNIAYNAREIKNNSVGHLTDNFLGCNIFPLGFDESVDGYNYIQEITPRVAMCKIEPYRILSDTTCIVKRTYYDAIYRPTLTFLFHHTPNQNNIVTLKEYDKYTRPTKEWLPIIIGINHLTSSTFKNNTELFYNTESRPFIEHNYSSSTWDNGVIKNELTSIQKAGIDMGSHKVEYATRGNHTNEVKLFKVTSNGLLECAGSYQTGMLRVSQTQDEDHNTKVIYTNMRNQVVMEKVGFAATYYVYNDLSQLCYVLPPLAINQLANGTYDEENDVLKKYAYIYKYDAYGNLIYKRLPGCAPIIMEYDKRNLLVTSQTGNQRNRGDYWTQYTYDKFCRLVRTTEIDKSGGISFDTLPAGELLMPQSSTYNLQIDGNNIQNVLYSSQLLSTKNYDTYRHIQLLPDQIKSHLSFQAFEGNTTYATNVKGLLTGSRSYFLDSSANYSETVYYYDYRGREIQRRTTNHLGGIDVLSTKYDFVNNITDTWSSQSTSNGLTTTEHYHYEYDHANRLLTTIYTFNNDSPIVLQSYHYDELGRVRSRHIHNGIDSVAFNYDIRNQVTQIKSSGYEQKYYYNQPCPIYNGNVEGLYNGNINATTWTYDNTLNGYIYRYDQMNRLMNTYSIHDGVWAFRQNTESFNYDELGNITRLIRWSSSNTIDDISFTYNGNQLDKIDDEYESNSYLIKQYHDNNTEGNDFAYDANGNMLYDKDRGIAAIRYNLLNLPDTIQFANGNQIVHRYDAAGNRLATDYYTRKVNVTVPLGDVFSATDSLSNYYITRDAFHNNIVYTANNTDAYGIEFVHNPEGYIRYYGPEEHYHFYYIKDLLGNIRETYVHPEAGYKECIQRIQYYPSGLPWAEAYSPSEQPWKYNGKEFVEMHGLDEYDSKARWYYPAICRTTTMDPLAEKYYSTSPYAWCGNNPVNIVDHDGRELWRLDINTGTFIRISDEGKDETDYYQIGTMINSEFAQYATIDIPRGSKDNINVFRYEETENSTISAYHIPNSINGDNSNFFLERPGPDTSISGKLLRIPQGTYMLAPNPGSKYPGVPRLYLDSEGTDNDFWTRGILIHAGNVPSDTEGCLLPGEQKFVDKVSNSRNALSSLQNYITAKRWNVQLNIYNVFPYEK